MKTILIAGGAGFLGSNLCKKLIQDNIVICLDNLITGNMTNIMQLCQNPNFKFIKHDIINPIDIEIDEIYNLACPASPIHYQKDPIHTLRSSIFGIYNLLELAKKYNAKILQASTSEVYGDPLEHPQKETYFGNVNINGPRSCYDEGKRCAESIMYEYNKQHNIQTRIARIFNTYGKNMQKDDGRVISNFIIQALKNEGITIYGDGSQTRSYCYVDDLIDGLIKLMASNITTPTNLGNPIEYTILKTAKIIISKTNSQSKLTFKDLPKDDPQKRKPDISKAKKELNWEPKISLNEGLDKTITYFKEII